MIVYNDSRRKKWQKKNRKIVQTTDNRWAKNIENVLNRAMFRSLFDDMHSTLFYSLYSLCLLFLLDVLSIIIYFQWQILLNYISQFMCCVSMPSLLNRHFWLYVWHNMTWLLLITKMSSGYLVQHFFLFYSYVCLWYKHLLNKILSLKSKSINSENGEMI